MLTAIAARLQRRRFLVLAVFFLTALTFYLCYSRYETMPLASQGFRPASPPDATPAPATQKAHEQKDKTQKQKPMTPMSYGTAARPPFKDLTNIMADLPAEYLPTNEGVDTEAHHKKKRRLIIVGDVHGQRTAFQDLLDRVSFDKKMDHVILTGDLINKGPDSPGVVQLAMDIGATAVRGNHEDRVLLAHLAMRTALAPGTAGESAGGLLNAVFGGGKDVAARPDETDTLELTPFSHGDFADRETAASLSPKQIRWLESLPVMLRVGDLGGSMGNLVVVHAGLVPGLPLDRQDPWAVMNMRTLRYPIDDVRRDRIRAALEASAAARSPKLPVTDEQVAAAFEREQAARRRDKHRRPEPGEDVAVPVDTREGEAWADAWNRRQQRLPDAEAHMTVVYGHDARTGLNVAKGETWTYGLDSGCVYGRKLSALVLEMGKKGVERKVMHVGCDVGVRELGPAPGT